MNIANRFENKVAIVTGGATGIGRATVEKLMDEGAQIFVLDIVSPPYALKNDSRFVYCDIAVISSITKAIDTVITSGIKGIDACFSNAGMHFLGNIEETSEEMFFQVLNTNFTGTFFLMKELLPIMKKQKSGGSIVLMGSDQSFVGKSQSSIYGATKGAIGQLTKSLSIDYASYNIRVNCICPGTIETPLYHNLVDVISKKSDIEKHEIAKGLATSQPIQRLGQPFEVAALVSFLLSSEASFMTGALVSVDGGYVAQ